jgi:DNA modification methylase
MVIFMVQLYNTDSIIHIKTMKNDSVNLTLTDIPYDEVNRKSNGLRNLDKGKADIFGSEASSDIDFLVDELVRITSGSIYMFCGINQISFINMRMQYHGLSTRLAVWDKKNPSPMNGEYIWLSGIEACVFGKKAGAPFNAHCEKAVWRYSSGKSNIHPTQKPIAMFKKIILASSDKNDVVFDPFLGSGTTGVAAKLLSRQFIGCEIDSEFYDKAKIRIDATTEEDEFFLY